MWKETPTGRREKPGAQKKNVKRPPEEPEDVGVTAERSGEKSIGGSKWGEVKHREEGGCFIQEGNRAPVSKATHSRYKPTFLSQKHQKHHKHHHSQHLVQHLKVYSHPTQTVINPDRDSRYRYRL